MNINEMVDDVLAHARDNYSNGGWDYVIECWDREEVAQEIEEGKCKNSTEAIARIASIVGIWEERRIEAQAMSGELEYYGLEEVDGQIVRKSV